MLVLSAYTPGLDDRTGAPRDPGESEIVIVTDGPATIVVHAVDVRGRKMRLGFTAERSVRIDRRKVHEAKARGPKPGADGGVA